MVIKNASTSVQVLSLIRQLRGAGFFTVVALASPFEFEGSRKTESANKLIEEVHHAAHLVSVIEQVCCTSEVDSQLRNLASPSVNACCPFQSVLEFAVCSSKKLSSSSQTRHLGC
jgi:hypothetical protein